LAPARGHQRPLGACGIPSGAELLVIWGVALHLASLGPLLYAAAISLLAHLLVVHVEEPELRSRFGEPYDVYRRDVPRWLPDLRRRRGVRS
jgi:protein-S-isoprenylcysteine O-methyltransferase Ste14